MSNNLIEIETKIRFLWSKIFPIIENDPGMIWTDEVTSELKEIESQLEKVMLVLKRVEAKFDFYKERHSFFSENLRLIQELIGHIERIDPNTSWIVHLNNDIQKIIDNLEEIYREYRVEKNNFNSRLRQIFVTKEIGNFFSSPINKISNFLETDKPILVSTGSGAIVKNSSEIFTNNLMGCVALFIFGPGGKMLAHMTPSSNIPYEIHSLENTMENIFQSLVLIGKPGDCFAVILGTLFDKYSYEKIYKEWENIKSHLEGKGVKSKIVEIPLEQVILYHSGSDYDFIYTYGRVLLLGKEGNLIRPNKTDLFKIPINLNIDVKFKIQR